MLGGDLSVKDARMQNVENAHHRVLIKNPQSKNINFFWAFNLILNLAIGSDQMFVPYGFQAGVLQAVLISVCLAILNNISFYIFASSWQFSTAIDYISTWTFLYGKRFNLFPSILIMLGFISLASSYSYEMWSEIAGIISYYFPDAPAILISPWLLCYVMNFICLLLSLWAKTLSDLRVFSLISNLAMFISGALIIVIAIIKIQQDGFDPDGKLLLWESDYKAETTNLCLSTFSAIYFLHPFFYYVLIDLEKPTFLRVQALNIGVTWVSCLSTSLTGILGYFVLWEQESDDVFLDYLNEEGGIIQVLTNVTKIFNYITIILSLSAYFWVIAFQFSEIMVPKAGNDGLSRALSGFVAYCLNIAFNFVNDSVYDWFDVLIQICNALLTYVLPVCYYLSSFGLTRPFSAAIAIMLFIVGMSISVFIIYQSILVITASEEEE